MDYINGGDMLYRLEQDTRFDPGNDLFALLCLALFGFLSSPFIIHIFHSHSIMLIVSFLPFFLQLERTRFYCAEIALGKYRLLIE